MDRLESQIFSSSKYQFGSTQSMRVIFQRYPTENILTC